MNRLYEVGVTFHLVRVTGAFQPHSTTRLDDFTRHPSITPSTTTRRLPRQSSLDCVSTSKRHNHGRSITTWQAWPPPWYLFILQSGSNRLLMGLLFILKILLLSAQICSKHTKNIVPNEPVSLSIGAIALASLFSGVLSASTTSRDASIWSWWNVHHLHQSGGSIYLQHSWRQIYKQLLWWKQCWGTPITCSNGKRIRGWGNSQSDL